jgi:putative transposase
VLRDQDQQFAAGWDAIVEGSGDKSMRLPRNSPNLNAFAERAIQTVKHDGLKQFVILGRRHLAYLLSEYGAFYNEKRPHSSRDRLPPVRGPAPLPSEGPIHVETRLGGLLKHYYRSAA